MLHETGVVCVAGVTGVGLDSAVGSLLDGGFSVEMSLEAVPVACAFGTLGAP